MSPLPELTSHLARRFIAREVTKPTDPNGLVLEAWAEGFMVGSLIIMTCITLANMRRRVLLHKLILIELIFGYWQGFFILFNPPIYAWWLSIAAIPLNMSWCLHNVIAWMKLRPFLSKNVSRLFIGTVILSLPYWVVEIYANFTYFHNVNKVFLKTRPFEALCRDPWWIVAAMFLMYNIKTKYDLSLIQIVRISPRFAVMLAAMLLSIIFIVLDVLSVTDAMDSVLPVGINPFWKLSFVFKCLTDCVVLDDFKTALDRLRAFKLSRLGSFAAEAGDSPTKERAGDATHANSWSEQPPSVTGTKIPISNLPAMPSPDSNYIQQPWKEGDSDANHLEHPKSNVLRTASRDRDMDESGVKIIDNSPTNKTSSDAPMISHHHGCSGSQSIGSSDLDDEYAMAVREVTHDTNRNQNKKGFGRAR